ncbi:MAG: rhodanese-like domain-containing protein [Deltaproteobacteria bacterium]|nr:rhodanese-like domain-containing protein [Deltaproteobacteria bacterium]
MLKTIAFAALATLAAPAAFAGDDHPGCDTDAPAATTAQAPAAAAPAAQTEPKKLEVADLAAMIDAATKNKTPLFIFDANTDKTRKDKGVIPAAVKLPSSSEYDLALLPKNKADAAVFYCAGLKCGASKSAAMRAIKAGYTNVHVLPAGIAGWVKAGKAVEKLPQA